MQENLHSTGLIAESGKFRSFLSSGLMSKMLTVVRRGFSTSCESSMLSTVSVLSKVNTSTTPPTTYAAVEGGLVHAPPPQRLRYSVNTDAEAGRRTRGRGGLFQIVRWDIFAPKLLSRDDTADFLTALS